jgi:hypothetical protein
MTDQEQVVLEISSLQRQRLEDLARRRGYEDVDDYLRALIEADAKAQGETLVLDDDENPIGGFREGWQDIMAGRTYPASTLWDDLDDDETTD